jgi:hypothetical protein
MKKFSQSSVRTGSKQDSKQQPSLFSFHNLHNLSCLLQQSCIEY